MLQSIHSFPVLYLGLGQLYTHSPSLTTYPVEHSEQSVNEVQALQLSEHF